MQELSRNIEDALSFETGIVILNQEECEVGLNALVWDLKQRYPDPDSYSLVPVLKSGGGLGQILSEATGVPLNPTQMSYYPESGVRLEKPICLFKPDIKRLYSDREKPQTMVITEGLIDTKATLQELVIIIRSEVDNLSVLWGEELPYPDIHIYAFASKTSNLSGIPQASVSFICNPNIWIWGKPGIDDEKDRGREEVDLKGKLSPFAQSVPPKPYVVPTSLTIEYSKAT